MKEDFALGSVRYYYGDSQESSSVSSSVQGYWDVLSTVTLYDFVSIKQSNKNREKASILFGYELMCDLTKKLLSSNK